MSAFLFISLAEEVPVKQPDMRGKFTTLYTCGWYIRAGGGIRQRAREEERVLPECVHRCRSNCGWLFVAAIGQSGRHLSHLCCRYHLLSFLEVLSTAHRWWRSLTPRFLHGKESQYCVPSMAAAPAPTSQGPVWLLAASVNWTPLAEASSGKRRSCCAPSSPPSSSCTASPPAAAPLHRLRCPPAGVRGSSRTLDHWGLKDLRTSGPPGRSLRATGSPGALHGFSRMSARGRYPNCPRRSLSSCRHRI